jgi:hypothetical protein
VKKLEKKPYYTFSGGIKHTIIFTQESEKIMRRVAPKKGELSKVINDLIAERYAPKPLDIKF